MNGIMCLWHPCGPCFHTSGSSWPTKVWFPMGLSPTDCISVYSTWSHECSGTHWVWPAILSSFVITNQGRHPNVWNFFATSLFLFSTLLSLLCLCVVLCMSVQLGSYVSRTQSPLSEFCCPDVGQLLLLLLLKVGLVLRPVSQFLLSVLKNSRSRPSRRVCFYLAIASRKLLIDYCNLSRRPLKTSRDTHTNAGESSMARGIYLSCQVRGSLTIFLSKESRSSIKPAVFWHRGSRCCKKGQRQQQSPLVGRDVI